MRVIYSIFLLLVVASGTLAQKINNSDNFWTILVDVFKFLLSEIDLDPDTDLSIEEFTTKYNYTLEAYNVTTEDHYILTVHRIPFGRNVSAEEMLTKRPVVFLAHGMTSSSMDWIWQGPNESLAFLLTDEGYDVWLFNGRGSHYSLGHETLTPENSSYWDYSFHERGVYDLPATIDLVMNKTNVQKITYIGHSEGTTNMMVLASSKPQYNDYMNLVIFLAPVAYTQHISSPVVQLIADKLSTIQVALNVIGFHGLRYYHELSMFFNLLCNSQSSLQGVCSFVLESVLGFNAAEVDWNKMTVYFSNAPAGVSVKEVVHYIQDMKSGYFRQYDYGTISNFIHYGSKIPPSYDIGKLTAPLGIYYSENDFLSAVADVENYISKLSQDTVFRKLIDDPYFNHLNFLFCTRIKPLVFDSLIELVKKYNPLSEDVIIT